MPGARTPSSIRRGGSCAGRTSCGTSSATRKFGGEAKALGKALVEETERMFRLWHMLKEGRLARRLRGHLEVRT